MIRPKGKTLMFPTEDSSEKSTEVATDDTTNTYNYLYFYIRVSQIRRNVRRNFRRIVRRNVCRGPRLWCFEPLASVFALNRHFPPTFASGAGSDRFFL
jgi:hypothetical protein